MPNGDAVATLRLATTDTWKDKQSGERRENTEWHRVVLFRKLGEIAGQYLTKGGQVYIEGSLKTRKWSDKEGVDRYTTEIIGETMKMLGSKPPSAGTPSTQGSPKPPAESNLSPIDPDDYPF